MDRERFGVTWTNRPADQEMQSNWQMVRAPSRGSISLMLASHDFVGAYTHYFGGRTRPCTGPGCNACNENQNPRWHGYVAGYMHATKRRVILELTAQAAKPLVEHFAKFRTLRGVIIEVGRTSNRPNARVFVRVLDTMPDSTQLKEGPDVVAILARVWELKHVETRTMHENEQVRPALHDPTSASVAQAAQAHDNLFSGPNTPRRHRRDDLLHDKAASSSDLPPGPAAESA